MKNLLAIETSSEVCSVALRINGETLQSHQYAPLKHAELLLPAVHSLLDEAGIGLGHLDAIVFGRGPGSFTSLRIGIGVVQGLAWGADLPVIPISSLLAVAQQALCSEFKNEQRSYPGNLLVAMDARMNEVFHASYQVSEAGLLLRQSAESVSPPGSLTVSEPGVTTGCGNGFERYPDLVKLGATLNSVDETVAPTATALIQLAQQWLLQHQPVSAAEAQPVYIRNHVADKPAPA